MAAATPRVTGSAEFLLGRGGRARQSAHLDGLKAQDLADDGLWFGH